MKSGHLILFLGLLVAIPRGTAAVSYTNEVMAVLSKAGCNTGGCHGNAKGKGGFKLSLWGDDPAVDWKSLTEKRRVISDDPLRSLVLRKPTLEAEHEGGKRLEMDSEGYRLILKWIEEGAVNDGEKAPRLESISVDPPVAVESWPGGTIKLRVTARFSDGQEKDVTPWAVYEPTSHAVGVTADGVVTARDPQEAVVMVRYLSGRAAVRVAFVPGRKEWSEAEESPSYIDRFIAEKQRYLGVPPSPVADDATFLRRVSLDVTGMIPSAEKTRAFLSDQATDKRTRVVDELLASPAYADFWALQWADLLRVEEVVLDSKGVVGFHGWIREAVKQNMPLDKFAHEILVARGSTYENPASNFWRALRTPSFRAEAVAQVFLGVRLQCAQCHNHPFDRWTQDDYYRFAGLMAGIDYEIKENKREDENDKNRFVGEQIVKVSRQFDWKDPRTGKPPLAGLLDPKEPPLTKEADPLEAMAEWITAKSPLFARTQANRLWFRLMGRGLIDPVDDVRDSNPASHPELLDALSTELVKSGYDQKKLIRDIVLSRAYQRSSVPVEGNEWDQINYTKAIVRRLTAEQLLDAIHDFLGLEARFDGYKEAIRSTEIPGIKAVYKKSKLLPCDDFLTMFGKPPRLTNSDMERANDTSLAQVFTLISGKEFHGWLRDGKNRFDGWIKGSKSPRDLLEILYLSSVNRYPSDAEFSALLPLLEKPEDRRRHVEDIAWSLINSKEFLLRH